MLFKRSERIIDGLREYVIHLTATVLICSVILRFVNRGGAVKMIIKLLCGIVLAYSMIQPIKQLKLNGFDKITEEFRQDAEQSVEWGKKLSIEAWSQSISQGVETYILEKAKVMGVDLVVEVELSDDEIPVPVAVMLTGDVAPYAKSVLSDTISQDLNIPKENQTWISH